jgi:hypothetical protein
MGQKLLPHDNDRQRTVNEACNKSSDLVQLHVLYILIFFNEYK